MLLIYFASVDVNMKNVLYQSMIQSSYLYGVCYVSKEKKKKKYSVRPGVRSYVLPVSVFMPRKT